MSPANPVAGDERRRLVEDVIQRRILSTELRPGQRVNESRLAEELVVSRTPVREALLRLEGQGWVLFDHGRGFVVTPLSTDEIRETYPIVAQLEQLALTSTGPALRGLAPVLSEINGEFGASTDPARSHDLDARFHRTLASRCGNGRLIALLDRHWQALHRYERFYMTHPDDHRRSVRQHDAIVAAIASGDVASAADQLVDNIIGPMHVLLERLR
ncbi:GntR family transcriptional regulator [Pseudonocardia sp. CA-107938]|uniref:GntR family transcriptional regulator n=1 Tax=Pseudonocardia sp. CA-107938 TaxID=3240021 RepID=UPI003D93120C